MKKRHVCTIIPGHVVDRIEKYGSRDAREAARKTRLVSDAIRRHRLAPLPDEGVEGENRQVYTANNGTKLPGTKVRSEDDPESTDQAVNEAYHASGNTYRFFHEILDRQSIDDANMALVNIVHYDRDFDNAFWDGQRMIYGDGKFFNPFTRDLTVIGHELAHGVTQYTANLDYQGQSGALNEHVSDVFGALVEQYAYKQDVNQATWLIGALLCEGKVQGRALRDMLNPGTAYDDPVIGKDPQPNHMDSYNNTPQDNGGVHINSGIPNRAFAEACRILGGYAWEKCGRIWYDVLTTRIKSNATFSQFANATYLSAGTLFDGGAAQSAVLDGWKAVGIDAKVNDEPAPSPVPDSPCMPSIAALVTDASVIRHVRSLVRNKKVREFLDTLIGNK